MKKEEMYMKLHRYDIIEAELDYGTGSIQKKRRPYVIVSNEKGTTNASIITVMPLTCIIKKENLPTHNFLEAETETGLRKYSMILGEQPQTICKSEVLNKLGTVTNENQRNKINKVCWNLFFYGENINWEEVFA
jgi:mRNA interferase MazF